MSNLKKTLDMGHNQIRGNIVFGQGCIINPTCNIICQKKQSPFKIIFGDYNIIEQKALIIFKPNVPGQNVMKIGSYNIFGIYSYVLNTDIGDCNIIQPRAELKDVKIGSGNIVGSQVKLYKKGYGNNHRFFCPGKIKTIDIFDQEKHKEQIQGLYQCIAATMAKPK